MKRILVFFFVLSLLLSGCQNLPQSLTEDGTLSVTEEGKESISSTIDSPPQASTEETREDVPTEDEREEEVLSSGHTHVFQTVSVRDATCTEKGEEIKRCSCGETKRIETALLNHAFTGPTCLEDAVCLSCGAKGAPALGHLPQNGRCTRCQMGITGPIFVLGKELQFDASPAEITHRLGNPTEILTEGEYVSYVYAQDLSRFTVIQTVPEGLWGVFTMDANAKFFLENQTLTIADFTGQEDPNSDAIYRDLASCRIFGFQDGIDGGNYAMWLRYEKRNYDYDYMNEPAIYSNYYSQSRLSFYYVNALRNRHSLSPLLWSEVCKQVGVEYCSYMIESGFFGHDNSYIDRLREKGVSFQNAGENLSCGYYNAFFVTDAYYNSQGHRKNILDPVFRYVGIGYVKRGGESPLVFGAQIYYS